ncbi:MAG: YjbH domain-containing protein [Pseudomonadota bacterium]
MPLTIGGTGTFARALALAAGLTAGPALAQTLSNNSYGVPGLIDMPSAQMQPNGELTTTLQVLSNASGRVQLAFQLTPRLQGVFRYGTIPNFLPVAGTVNSFERTFDRSFDVRYQLLTENIWRPAVTIGLQDFGGTSLFGAEYVVATKTFRDRWTVTGGIGWGRLGTRGNFTNPLGIIDSEFEVRPALDFGVGGDFEPDQWFQGDAAFFGGVQYQFNDRLVLKAEYSSDLYVEEQDQGVVGELNAFNFGFDYEVRTGLSVGAYLLGGREVGATVTFALNPKRPANGSGLEEAPLPITLRPARATQPDLWTEAWVGNGSVERPVTDALAVLLDDAGLKLIAYNLDGDTAEVRFRNLRYGSTSQAIGRAARAMTATMPASVETFVLVPISQNGLTGTAVVLRRSDLEALEFDPTGTQQIEALAGLVDAATLNDEDLIYRDDAFPRFDWSIGPYTAITTFDPDNPLRIDLGVEVASRYEPIRGLVFRGAVRQRLIGNRDEFDREAGSLLTPVRTDSPEFANTAGPFIPSLTASYFFRPGKSLYARGSFGYLETQFAGVSAEVLWKPTYSRLAIGAEVSRVVQRSFDMDFNLQTLDATTAFVSGYLDHGNGFISQLDVGQYLAGDRGATFTLTREFDNGWAIGAFATLTNVSSEEFGEGAFDRGIRLTIPLSWVTGRPSRRRQVLLIQPIQRDGGARLNLNDRLFPMVRDQTPPDLTDEWGRFWR